MTDQNRLSGIEARWTPGSPALVARIAAIHDVHALLERVRELEAGLRAIVDGSSEHSEAAWLAAVDTELINDARRLLE